MDQHLEQNHPVDRYAQLCDRAIDFVESQGGSVGEDLLIRHIFGTTGSSRLWSPLLQEVLSQDERVSYRGNGDWCMSNGGAKASTGLLLPNFVALDVETTGLKPSRNRVIEIGAIRFRNGVIERKLETLLNPARTIPAFITRLTSIRNEDVADAPTFDTIAQDLLDFVGDDVIVGHNVAFDLGFINMELERAGFLPLANDRLDTLGLSRRLLPHIRKPNLDNIAATLGLNPRTVHRAGDDARLTADVAMLLMEEAARQGIASFDRLKSAAFVPQSPIHEDVGRARVTLDRSLAENLPKRPGVYIMRDANEQIIYIGKARNLRTRVMSYYSQPVGITRKMDGLIESVARIDHHVVGSELAALLLESQLIQRYQPRYNTALRKSEHYPWIKIDITNPWPRITLARSRADDDALYFGPYTNATNARRTVEVINSALQLRSCTRSFRNARSYGKPCLALDLGQCLGPCTGKLDRDTYQARMQKAIQFLRGEDDAIYQHLHEKLEDAAAALDFERADRIRKEIHAVTTILEHQLRLIDAERLHNLVMIMPGVGDHCVEAWIVYRGQLWATLVIDREQADWEKDLVPRLEQIMARINTGSCEMATSYDVDARSLLMKFLFRHAENPSLIPIELDDVGQILTSAAEMAHRVASVSVEDITELDASPHVRGTDIDKPDIVEM